MEREISRVVLPFAAGVAMTVWSGHVSHIRPCFYSGLTMAVILISASFLLFSRNRQIPPSVLRSAICICLASCGILCGLTSELLSSSRPYADSIMESIRAMGRETGRLIDGIDFKNQDTNAILKALIIGDRSDIPAHITESFRSSGASHILALSGLHLGIIHYIFSKILSLSGNSPKAQMLRSGCIILLRGLYTLATGAGASIVRAYLFIIIGERSRFSNSFKSTGTVLMSALLIHLTISPASMKEAGFLLSYAAIAGIAYIFPWLKSIWPESEDRIKGPVRRIWESAALSISCQFTTGPLAYLYFGTFPRHFLLTNLIAIPLTGLIIPASLLTICMEAVGTSPEIMKKAVEALISALSTALDIISRM